MAAPYGNQTEVQAIWQEGFLEEVKQDFTAFINTFVFDEKKKLAVFDKHSPYLATKKIGKNNPRAEQIKTDNWAKTERNRTVDRALVENQMSIHPPFNYCHTLLL